VLHLKYWLAHNQTGKGSASPVNAPLLVIADARGRELLRMTFLPHRERAWSGWRCFATNHPYGQGPLGGRRRDLVATHLLLKLPAQPSARA